MAARALFVDRDGVLNANFIRDGKPYAPRSFAEFRLLPGVAEALNRAKAAGFLVIVITNQPDVPNGITHRTEVDTMHAWLREHLPIEDIRVCFHTDSDRCQCRKPEPGLLLEAAAQCDIDLGRSYMIGDRWRDVLAGQAAGCFTIFVDYRYVDEKPMRPDKVVSTLAEAVDFILGRTDSP